MPARLTCYDKDAVGQPANYQRGKGVMPVVKSTSVISGEQ